MSIAPTECWSRRAFLGELTLAGTVGLLSLYPRSVAAEPPPETTKVRLLKGPTICMAPQYVAEALLRGEGFAEVTYVAGSGPGGAASLAAGEVDLAMQFAGPSILRVDAGDSIVFLAGGHVGCLELFGNDRVRAVRDLKGKTVAVSALGSPPHVFLTIVLAYVGLDHRKDIRLSTSSQSEAIHAFAEGKVDALITSPPFAQELRAKQLGQVLINSSVDRPWSQYFCCIIAGNRQYVREHPVATKRALRAILKAADLCALEPDLAARTLVDRGFTERHDYALQAMQDVPYGQWREYDPEDTVRFYALRLHEAGMIKSSPQKIIAQGTDWRFLNELKKELKG
jgi:NitT/TauT family transport system substrate-binding protein